MAGPERGLEYERNVVERLQSLGLVEQGFVPAGGRSDVPDLVINYNGKKCAVELKFSGGGWSAGSLKFKHEHGVWALNEDSVWDHEFVESVAVSSGALQHVNRCWPDVPLHVSNPLPYGSTKEAKKSRYQEEKKRFISFTGHIDQPALEKYYNARGCWYINLSCHGFYALGKSDPLGLNLPLLSESAEAYYRCRVQYKGRGDYQHVLEMQMRKIKPSPFNLGRTNRSSPEIIDSSIGCFASS